MVDTDKKIYPNEISMPNPSFCETVNAGTELRIYGITDHIKVLV